MPRPNLPSLVAVLALAPAVALGGALHGALAPQRPPEASGRRTPPRPLGYWRLDNGRLPIAPARGEAARGPAIVILEPLEGAPPPAAPTRASIEVRGVTLEPRLVAIPVGSTVELTNADHGPRTLYLHDGEAIMPRQATGPGGKREVVFAQAGVYEIRDADLPHAGATIVVVETPWFARSDEFGEFTIEAPDGRYNLRAWLGGVWSLPVTVEVGGPRRVQPIGPAAAMPGRVQTVKVAFPAAPATPGGPGGAR